MVPRRVLPLIVLLVLAAPRPARADFFITPFAGMKFGGSTTIVAGNGSTGAPTAGPATSSALGEVHDVAVDSSGNLYIADYGNNLVEKVTPGGTLSIFAFSGAEVFGSIISGVNPAGGLPPFLALALLMIT